MLSIGAERLYREVIESFVEYTVNSNFTPLRLDIVPNDVLCGMWDISKEATFSSFILKPLLLEFLEYGPKLNSQKHGDSLGCLSSGRQMNMGRTLSVSRKCILDMLLQDMKESRGLVCNGKSSTNQTTFDTIEDSTMRTFDRSNLGQRIRTGRKKLVPVLFEKVSDFEVSI